MMKVLLLTTSINPHPLQRFRGGVAESFMFGDIMTEGLYLLKGCRIFPTAYDKVLEAYLVALPLMPQSNQLRHFDVCMETRSPHLMG